MNLFEAVKASVTTREAAEHYGVKVNRAGKACCIFHDDRHPSIKIDSRYHCFTCGADGDVIDFAAQLFGVTLKDAAQQLAADFNISYDHKSYKSITVNAKKSLLQRLKNYRDENYQVLCRYFRLLQKWKAEYAPKPEDTAWHPLFVEASKNSARVEYLLDKLQACSPGESKSIIAAHKNKIMRYANRVNEFRTDKKRLCEAAR